MSLYKVVYLYNFNPSESMPVKSSTTSDKNSQNRLVRSFMDQQILNKLKENHYAIKVSELAEKIGIDGLTTTSVRAFLSSNPDVYAYVDRRWIPASRVYSDSKSLHECIYQVVYRYGAPIDLDLLVKEISYSRGVYQEDCYTTVERIVSKSKDYILTEKNQVALFEWVFEGLDQPMEYTLRKNRINLEEFNKIFPKVNDLNWYDEGAIEKFLKEYAPVSVKLVGALIWASMFPDNSSDVINYNSKEFGRKILSTPGYIYGLDGVIYAQKESEKWLSGVLELSRLLVPVIEADDIAPIDVKKEDIAKMSGKILKSDRTITAEELLEQFYEISPAVKSFDDDLVSLIETLANEPSIAWIGADRFSNPNRVPEIVQSIPEPLLYQNTDFLDESGDPIDFVISDEGLSSSLRKLLQHPLACDVNDEDTFIPPKPRMQQYRLVLKSIHRELGTFPLSQLPSDWINKDPEVQELIFIDPSGKEHQVWVNNKDRLMFNLIDLWFEQPVESGAVFILTKTGRTNVFNFEWMEQPDPVVFITPQRMEELREIQERSHELSSCDVLKEVLAHWSKGTDFLTVLWEMNVVRRTSRRLLASLLSSYQCFFQRSGSPVWHYDHKKVELGVDKTKKKFIIK